MELLYESERLNIWRHKQKVIEEKSARYVSKAVNGIKENFEKERGQKASSVEHSKVSEDDDLKEVIKDLIPLDLFSHSDGRKHDCFPDIFHRQ